MLDLVKVLGILRGARGRIEDPEKWCVGTYMNGVQACAVASLYIAAGDAAGNCLSQVDDLRETKFAFRSLHRIIFGDVRPDHEDDPNYAPGEERLYLWNDEDGRTHPEVLAAFDKAIAAIEAQINPLAYGFVLPEPTPNADAALAVLEACEEAGGVVARQIVTNRPGLDFEEVASVAASELFYAAQDTAKTCFLGVKVERA